MYVKIIEKNSVLYDALYKAPPTRKTRLEMFGLFWLVRQFIVYEFFIAFTAVFSNTQFIFIRICEFVLMKKGAQAEVS